MRGVKAKKLRKMSKRAELFDRRKYRELKKKLKEGKLKI